MRESRPSGSVRGAAGNGRPYRDLTPQRQAEGIAKAKAEGLYKGGKKQIDRERFAELQASGTTPTQIAKELGISSMSVYRLRANSKTTSKTMTTVPPKHEMLYKGQGTE
jgi:DNA invertase Pin-like site-specific DNA recombinase